MRQTGKSVNLLDGDVINLVVNLDNKNPLTCLQTTTKKVLRYIEAAHVLPLSNNDVDELV